MSADGSIVLFQVDTFANQPFTGNPAAVCLIERPLDESLMQSIAMELNVSETAFIRPLSVPSIHKCRRFRAHWFTPEKKLDAGGHSAIACACVLRSIYGSLSAGIILEGAKGRCAVQIGLNCYRVFYPAADPRPFRMPEIFFNALRLDRDRLADHFKEACVCEKTRMLLLRFGSVEAIRKIQPDFGDLRHVQEAFGLESLIVTACDGCSYDFVSRTFAPILGIPEDPVSALSHRILVPYWGALLNKSRFLAYQASRRGGELTLELRKGTATKPDKVAVSGNAIITLEATINLDLYKEYA